LAQQQCLCPQFDTRNRPIKMGCRSSKSTAAPFPSLAEGKVNDAAKAEVPEPAPVDAATPLKGAAPMEPLVKENLEQEPKDEQTVAVTQDSKDEGTSDALMKGEVKEPATVAAATPLEGASPMEPLVKENLEQEPKDEQTVAVTQDSKDEGTSDALMKGEVKEPATVAAATPLEGASPMEPLVKENLEQEPKDEQTDAVAQDSKHEGTSDALMTADANQTHAVSDLTPSKKLDDAQNFAEHEEEQDDLQLKQQQTKDVPVEVTHPQTSGLCCC